MIKDTSEVDQAIKKAETQAGEETIILIARNIADPDGTITTLENGKEKNTGWTNCQLEDFVITFRDNFQEVVTIESVWDIRKQKYHSITTWYRRPLPRMAGGSVN